MAQACTGSFSCFGAAATDTYLLLCIYTGDLGAESPGPWAADLDLDKPPQDGVFGERVSWTVSAGAKACSRGAGGPDSSRLRCGGFARSGGHISDPADVGVWPGNLDGETLRGAAADLRPVAGRPLRCLMLAVPTGRGRRHFEIRQGVHRAETFAAGRCRSTAGGVEMSGQLGQLVKGVVISKEGRSSRCTELLARCMCAGTTAIELPRHRHLRDATNREPTRLSHVDETARANHGGTVSVKCKYTGAGHQRARHSPAVGWL